MLYRSKGIVATLYTTPSIGRVGVCLYTQLCVVGQVFNTDMYLSHVYCTRDEPAKADYHSQCCCSLWSNCDPVLFRDFRHSRFDSDAVY